MTRTKRAIAIGLVVMMAGALTVDTPALAEPNPLCYSNPAYRSMHEECEKDAPGNGRPGGNNSGGGGLGGLLHRLTGGLL